LHPERRALAYGRELRRLEMGVSQAGQVGRAPRERFERAENRDEPSQQQAQPLPHDDQVGVVGDEGAGGAEMEIGARRGGLVAEGVDVRHHVVPEPALVPRRRGEVRVVQVRAHLGQRFLGNGEPQLALRLREREPQPAPEPDTVRLAPEDLHRRRGVAGAQRRAPAVVGHRNTRSVKVICPSRSR
jgi:hypothetical protein